MELHLWFNCCNKIPARTQQQICKTKHFSSKTLVLLEETKLWSECDLGIVEQIDLFSMTCKTSAKNHQQLVLSHKRVCFSPSTPHRQLFRILFLHPFRNMAEWQMEICDWLTVKESLYFNSFFFFLPKAQLWELINNLSSLRAVWCERRQVRYDLAGSIFLYFYVACACENLCCPQPLFKKNCFSPTSTEATQLPMEDCCSDGRKRASNNEDCSSLPLIFESSTCR